MPWILCTLRFARPFTRPPPSLPLSGPSGRGVLLVTACCPPPPPSRPLPPPCGPWFCSGSHCCIAWLRGAMALACATRAGNENDSEKTWRSALRAAADKGASSSTSDLCTLLDKGASSSTSDLCTLLRISGGSDKRAGNEGSRWRSALRAPASSCVDTWPTKETFGCGEQGASSSTSDLCSLLQVSARTGGVIRGLFRV